jgi:hypothetical protein
VRLVTFQSDELSYVLGVVVVSFVGAQVLLLMERTLDEHRNDQRSIAAVLSWRFAPLSTTLNGAPRSSTMR